MPTSPQCDAGIRIDPPVSDPIPPGTIRAATAAPVPPLDPPALRSRSHGFLVGGVYTPHASSCVVVFPRTIAPAALSLATAAESLRAGGVSFIAFDPQPVFQPATSKISLIATGIPLSGPPERPSLALASRSTVSSSTETKA